MSLASCKATYYTYYKERNHDSCHKAAPKPAARKMAPLITERHAALTRAGIPRRKDGNKLGLRKRREMLELGVCV